MPKATKKESIILDFQRLKNAAHKKELSTAKVAKLAGISQQGVSAIFNGRRTPAATTLKKICDVIDIPIQEVFIDRQAA